MDLTEWYAHFGQLVRINDSILIQTALDGLMSSFKHEKDQQQWVYRFFDGVFDGQKIPQILYDAIIFPVLYDGYQHQNALSIRLMAKTINNLTSNPVLHSKVQNASAFELTKKSYLLMPSEESRKFLLNDIMRWLKLCVRDYPMVLYGTNSATRTECLWLLDDIKFARSLDTESQYQGILDEIEKTIRYYRVL